MSGKPYSSFNSESSGISGNVNLVISAHIIHFVLIILIEISSADKTFPLERKNTQLECQMGDEQQLKPGTLECKKQVKDRKHPKKTEEQRKVCKEYCKANEEYLKERRKQYRLTETPEQRAKRLEKLSVYGKNRRLNRTPEQIEEDRQKKKERYQNMSEERRKRFKEQCRLSYIKKKKNMTPEQKARLNEYNNNWRNRKKRMMTESERQKYLAMKRASHIKQRQAETAEQRTIRLEKLRQRKLMKKMMETEEEREERVKKDHDYYFGVARMRESEVERMQRLEKQREYRRNKKMNETEEERHKRIVMQREYYHNFSKFRPRVSKKRRKGSSSDVQQIKMNLNSENTAETDEMTTVRPTRPCKSTASMKIRNQLKTENLFPDAELVLPTQDNSLVRNFGQMDDKLNLKAVVLLERVHIADFNKSQIKNEATRGRSEILRKTNFDNSMDEKALVKKWRLRQLVVSLERIDLTKAILKS